MGEIADISWGDTSTTKASYVESGYTAYSATGPDGYLPTANYKRSGIVISAIGAQAGKTWLATGEWSCIKNTLRILPASDQISIEFLYWATRRDNFWPIRGSAQPFISQGDCRDLTIYAPPVQVQQAIAEVLGALDNKIAANTKLAATADEFLSAHLSALLDSDFEEVRLGDVAEVNAQTVKPTSGGSLRYVDIASVGVGAHEYPEIMSWDDAPSRARRRLREGDTIWSTVRPNRRSHSLNLSVDPLLVASTGLAVLSPAKVGFAYLYEVTKRPEFTAYLENVAEGSAYPAVRADRFAEALIPLLLQDDLTAFEALAAPIREHIHSLSVENKTLAATRDALLPQLMSGKLRVKDAETLLSASL